MSKLPILLLPVILFLSIHTAIHAQEQLLDLYHAGAYEEVIRISTENIAGEDSGFDHHYLKALSQIQLGRNSDAIATLENVLRLFPGDATFTRMLAGQYFETGAYPKAEVLYSGMVASDSSDISSLIKMAEVAQFGQRFKKSLLILDQVLSIDSMNLKGLMMTGEILTRQNDSAAMVYYQRAYRLYPQNQQAAYTLANWYIQSDMPEKAIPVCASILEEDSTNLRFHKLSGLALYRSGKPNDAIDHFEKALALEDSTTFTLKYLGISRYMIMDFPGAIPPLEEALARDSMDTDSHFFLGASLATTTRKTEAMQHLDKALELMQPDPRALSRIYSEQGNLKRLEMEYEHAYDLYRLSWETDTTNPMPLYYMASILDNSLHRSSEALVDYQRFLDELDQLPDASEKNDQIPTIREIVEDRIILLREELFFLDEQ
jgi:tetratricopeptide (TPR) repeat protein